MLWFVVADPAFLTFLPPANEVAEVMFLHVSVILFTGGRGVCPSACWDTTPPRDQAPPSHQTPPGDQVPPRDQAFPLPGTEHTRRYDQRAGGRYPTGMHSCYQSFRLWGVNGRPSRLLPSQYIFFSFSCSFRRNSVIPNNRLVPPLRMNPGSITVNVNYRF